MRNSGFSGLHATGGTQYVNWLVNTNQSVTFTFGTAIQAFGLTFTDPMDGSANPGIGLFVTGRPSYPTALPGLLTSGAEVFVGVVTDNPFTQSGGAALARRDRVRLK